MAVVALKKKEAPKAINVNDILKGARKAETPSKSKVPVIEADQGMKELAAEIPELVGELPIDGEKALRLSILSLVESNSAAIGMFLGKGNEMPYYSHYLAEEAWKRLAEMPGPELLETLKRLSLICLMDKNTTIPKIRREVANHLGSDLKTEWRITPEYLQKKTVSEIHAIAKQFKLFEDEKAQKFLIDHGKKAGRFDTCKKGELVKIILESGIDLAGVVPEEILAK